MEMGRVWLTGITAAVLTGATFPWPASAVPLQRDDAAIIKRADDVTSGTAWDVILPADWVGHVQEQAWLVVDGRSEGLGGGDIPSADYLKRSHKPLRLYANVSDRLDGEVKDVLKAQGLPVQAGVTTYRVHYGVLDPNQVSAPETVHFRNSAVILAFQNDSLPQTAHFKIGDRITIFDAVALDSAAIPLGAFDSTDPRHRVKSGLPPDVAHHIMIQVQFLPVSADGKLIQTSTSR